jgi:SAM-dependent methyltransferase
MSEFTSEYYDADYFASQQGKEFRKGDGNKDYWGYKNQYAEWYGAAPICKAWKEIFGLSKCNTEFGLCKALDVGCGRGTFTAYMRDVGIEAWGFDFSGWAVGNPYPRCDKGWIVQWDATDKKGWPYGSLAFDFVVALDFFEHLYADDIEYVISEMYRVSKRFIFLQIATVGGGSGTSLHEKGYILRKGEDISVELEGVAVAGHVTVQDRQFWIDNLMRGRGGGWEIRDDLVEKFKGTVPKEVIANWVKNTIIVLQKTD